MFSPAISLIITLWQLVDLGEPAHSGGSIPGCRIQEDACMEDCGHHGACVGGLNLPSCECEPGWVGPGCSMATTPAMLGRDSYMRVALSFLPPPTSLRLQARVRASRGATGTLLHVAAQHNTGAFTLHVGDCVHVCVCVCKILGNGLCVHVNPDVWLLGDDVH